MKDSCKVSKSTTNHRIDMNKSLDITAAIHHFESVSQFLRDDYSGARELCDVTLRFDDESIPAHWVMLAAYSPAFAEKFRKPNKCFVLEMQPLDKTSVKRVLDYIYFGKVTFRLATLHEDLKAISYFEIVTLQEDVEKRLVELAKGNCVDVLNLVTANLKTIPHSPSTILLISDESVRDIVSILHDTYSTNRLSYEEILSLSTNTVITCLSARIPDFKKVDIINMSLKWIYERHLNDHKACKILQGLTLGSMTYAELVNLRNSLIQTAIPVTIGRCVRLKRRENDTLDIVFTYGESSGYQKPGIKPTITSSFTMNNDPTSGAGTPSTKTSRSPSNKFDDAISESWNVNLDDCNTAMSFNDEDLKRLGIEKSKKMKKKEQEEM
ncbi:BTB domain-containing protein [Caenorhabditis elegans]|uniref:BTB domain-containing protein n=3 Tax=Caenorhabditis elegans TaxID=6239 RepID=A0A0K3AS98_CAEEL|nr:BTB domain-containing protein [Caenorhabditis elegans]CTQ86866.1 BTB domain-containing protein [Caenorhabditis elegans]|eukprot:NP_001300167.1 Uncharacterized protein CELE_R09A1.2 [Caenorhabditis elegans]